MGRSTCVGILFAVSAACLLTVASASANTVPTRTQSSYGEQGSTIESTNSFTSDGVTINGQSFCSFSNSSGDSCALTYAYQLASSLPLGATSLTFTVPVPAGASLSSTSPLSFGILTNDDGGSVTSPDVFFSPNVSNAQLLALGPSVITFGTENSDTVAFLTIGDLSQIPDGGNGLAFFMDVIDNATAGAFVCPALN